MIGTDTYCTACKLKKAYVFVVFMRDPEFQAREEARPETDHKNMYLRSILIF